MKNMKKSELETNQLLWKPGSEKIKKTSIYKFIQHVNLIYKVKIENFTSLHKWSVENRSDFIDYLNKKKALQLFEMQSF